MRYYFDILDSAELTADEFGMEFDSDEATVCEAMRSLGDWANDSAAEAGSQAVMVIIRDERREIARLRLRLQIELARRWPCSRRRRFLVSETIRSRRRLRRRTAVHPPLRFPS